MANKRLMQWSGMTTSYGVYVDSGSTYNGQPYYTKDTYYLYWDGSYWCIHNVLGTVYSSAYLARGTTIDGDYVSFTGMDRGTMSDDTGEPAEKAFVVTGNAIVNGTYLKAGYGYKGFPYYFCSAISTYLYPYGGFSGLSWGLHTSNGSTFPLYNQNYNNWYPKTGSYLTMAGSPPSPTVSELIPVTASANNAVGFSDDITGENSAGTNNTNSFNQVVDKYAIFNRSASNNITFQQVRQGLVGEQADVRGGFNHSASAFINKPLSRNVRFNQVVTKYKIHPDSHIENMTFHQTITPVNSKGVHTNVALQGVLCRAYIGDSEQDLAINQDLDKIEYADPTSGFGQVVTCEVVKPGNNSLMIGQSASPAGSIYTRSRSSGLGMRSVVRLFIKRPDGGGTGGMVISTDGINYNPRVADVDDPVEGECPIVPCTADHISLSYNGYFGAMDMDLRNPYEDSQGLQLNIINDYTRGQELQNLKNAFPTFETLNYKFQHLTLTKREEFFTFYKLSAGDEITLTDYCGRAWLGVILDPECRSETYARGGVCDNGLFYNLSFKFEGTLI